MIRTYSILSTNGELQSSPYIKKLEQKYDLVLTSNEPKIVNFLFQIPLTRFEAHDVYALYDEDALDLGSIYVDCFTNQTLISTTITPKDIGALKLSLVVPDHLALAGVKADRAHVSSGY